MFNLRAASRNKVSFSRSVDFLRDLDAGNLAQELAGRVRSAVRRIEDGVAGIARSKFQAVVAFQLLPLNAFAVDERAVLAALINEKESVFFEHDQRVIARDPRIGDHQILIHFAAHAERRAIEDDVLLLVPLHQHQRREHTGTGGLRVPIAFKTMGCSATSSPSLTGSRSDTNKNNDRNQAPAGRALVESAPVTSRADLQLRLTLIALHLEQGQREDQYRQGKCRKKRQFPATERPLWRCK